MKLFDDGDQSAEPFEELPDDPVSESQARSSRHGREFDGEAFQFLEDLGARIVERYVRVDGYPLDALIEGTNGRRFYVSAHGTPDRTDRPQAGMRRQDTMLKFGFKALRLRDRGCPHPLLLVTSHMPKKHESAAFLLTELSDAVFDAVATVGDLAGQQRLREYLHASPIIERPLGAPWRTARVNSQLDFFSDDGDPRA
jgi:hypothetical protein